MSYRTVSIGVKAVHRPIPVFTGHPAVRGEPLALVGRMAWITLDTRAFGLGLGRRRALRIGGLAGLGD